MSKREMLKHNMKLLRYFVKNLLNYDVILQKFHIFT